MARPHFQRLGLNILASGPQIPGAVWVVSMSADAMVVDVDLDVHGDEDEDEDEDSGAGSPN